MTISSSALCGSALLRRRGVSAAAVERRRGVSAAARAERRRGAGKSTLLRLLNGRLQLTTGDVLMLPQAAGLWLTIASGSFNWRLTGSVLLGIGTAMADPALIAVVSDASHPQWRARSLGVYRFRRDLGYAVGALLAGIVADMFGITWAIATVAGITFASGLVVVAVMRET